MMCIAGYMREGKIAVTECLVEVKGLKKHFPLFAGFLRRQVNSVKAVDGIDFRVHRGEVLGMVGESGSGKSTAGRCTIRLLEPSEGSLRFDGQDLAALTPQAMRRVRREIQMVFQDPYASLNPRRTIGEALGEPLTYHGLVKGAKDRETLVAEILKQVGLNPDVVNRYPHEFSGGQQQRICIGRAIALQPRFIVCDEAVSALDVSVQAQILNLLSDLQEELGLSYLFISHDLSVVRHICDRVVVMYLGKVMEAGSVEALFSDPKHPYTKALLSAVPKEHPRETRQRLALQGELPSPIDPPKGCPFHTRCPFAKLECQERPPPRKVLPDTGLEGEREYHCIL